MINKKKNQEKIKKIKSKKKKRWSPGFCKKKKREKEKKRLQEKIEKGVREEEEYICN